MTAREGLPTPEEITEARFTLKAYWESGDVGVGEAISYLGSCVALIDALAGEAAALRDGKQVDYSYPEVCARLAAYAPERETEVK